MSEQCKYSKYNNSLFYGANIANRSQVQFQFALNLLFVFAQIAVANPSCIVKHKTMSTILSASKGVQRYRILRIGHLHVRSVGASHKVYNYNNSALRTSVHGSRCVQRCKPIFASVRCG